MAANPYLDLLNVEEQRVATTDSATGVPPKNPYLDTLESDDAIKRAQQQAALRTAVQVNPDEAAEANRLAAARELPPELVLRNLQEIQRQEVVDNGARRMEVSPALSNKMRDLAFAQIAHDNIENLANIEQRVKDYGELRTFQGPEPTFGSYLSGVWESVVGQAKQASAGISMQIGDALDATGVTQPDPVAQANRRRQYLQAGAQVENATPAFETDTAKGVYSGVASTASMIVPTALSVLMRNPTPALAAMGVQTGYEAYGKYRSRGASPGEAFVGGASEGAVEVLTEKIPMGFIVNKFGKTGAKEFLAGMLLREAPTEQVATFLQDAIDTAIANPDKTWGEFWKERPSAAYQTLLATLTQSSIMGGAHGAAHKIAERAQRQQQQSEQGTAVLADLLKLAEKDKLRERDPGAFASMVQAVAEQHGTPTEVFIDAGKLVEAFAQSGMTPEQINNALPSAKDQLAAAVAAGGDVSVPIGEFTSLVAGSGLEAALVKHARLSPDALSQEDVKLLGEVDLKTETEKAVAQQTAADESTALRQQVVDELNAAGRFTPAVNAAYADSVTALYETQAARLGISVAEFAKKYPLNVRGEIVPGASLEQGAPTKPRAGMGPAARNPQPSTSPASSVADSKAVDQTQTEAFKKWFADSKVVGDNGEPHPVFHVTRQDFTEFKTEGNQTSTGDTLDAAFFTDSVDYADAYAYEKRGEGLRTVPAYLSLRNPMTVQADSRGFADPRYEQPIIERARAAGHDGVVFVDPDTGDRFYAVFKPEQIKSATGNDGTFDANDPNILSQNAIDPKGTFTPATNTIALLAKADLSTFHHELGHFYLEMLTDMAAQPDAPASVVEDMNRVLEWFGISSQEARGQGVDFVDILKARAPGRIFSPEEIGAIDKAAFSDAPIGVAAKRAHLAVQDVDGSTLSKIIEDIRAKESAREALAIWRGMTLAEKEDYHEKFARGYEAYLFEGKAPSTALARTFQRFSEWVRRIYKSIKTLNVEINDDIRRVYDRMLASEEAIKEAEAARAYAPLFKDEKALKEAGVDPAEYHALGTEATAQAVDQLQARSLRDMRWLANAKDRALKALQKDAKTARAAIESQVAEEVGRQPVYAAENFLRRGVLPEDDRNNAQRRALDATQGMNTKLDLATLKEMYGDAPAAPWRYLATGKTGLATTTDGLHPDIVAEIFGFPSGDALVRELLAAEPQAQVIEGMTDQRMLEEHGELSSPDALERAAEQAIHNEARGKFIATELAALDKALGPARVLVAAAKHFSEAVIGRKTLNDIKPHVFTAAEARAAKQAQKLLGKSTEEAATAKRNQLLNHYAARYAHDALGEITRIREFFKRVADTPDDKLKTRDMDVVNAARAVLAAYGVGRKGEAAADYLKKVAAYDPDMSQVLQGSVDAALQNAKPLAKLSLDELRALNDEVASLWHLAKRSRQMEIDGDLLDREEVQDDLKARLDEIGIPDRIPGEGSAVTPAEQRLAKLRSFVASARRTESWVGAKDGGDTGPFRRFIWQPVKEAADAYRTDKTKALKQFRELLKPIAPTLKKRLIDAPELGYTFGKDEGGVGLSEVLHAVLHTGNESNKRKLLLGRKWGTERADGTLDTSRWDSFIKRMVDEGMLKKEHFDFVQGVWDLLETTKPLAQKTHRDVFGKYFAEITAEPVDTPFGQYRGGYVPALADPRAVSDAAIRQLMEQENSSMQFAFPATNKGFTKARVEYNRPLLLDLKSIPQHLDKVLLFSHMERPVRDVRRVLTSNAVAYGLNRIDPKAFSSMLTPWLNRAARQQVETPAPDHWMGWRFWSVVRGRAGIAAMFGNIVNAAQQVTGFSIAALKVRPKHLLGATASYMASPRKTARTVAEASPYMAARMENEIAHMNDAIREVLIDPTVYQSTKAFFARHAYFMQSAVDNVMGPIIWTGAYNQALEQGQSEIEAHRFADATIRETQGSTLPEDISNFETGPAFVRMFTQFAGYFNMQANMLGTEFAKIPEGMGLSQKAAKGFFIFTLGFLVPALVSEAMVQAFRGGPDDDDKDGEYLDDWLAALSLGMLRNITAMVPVAGQGINALVNAANVKPYDDRLGTSPAISMIEAAVRGAVGVPKKLLEDKDIRGRDVRDVATLISMALGIPVNVAAKPVIYEAEQSVGRVTPTSDLDAARGYLTGTASPGSK